MSQIRTSIEAIEAGHGFAWLPQEKIRDRLEAGTLVELDGAGRRYADLYLVFTDPDDVGPGARRLGECLRESVRRLCPAAARHAGA